MEYVPKRFASGRLASSDTAVYTVPTATTASIRAMTLVNVGSIPAPISVKVVPATGSTFFLLYGMTVEVGYKYDDNSMVTLVAGDVLHAWASTGSVDFCISGMEGA